MAHVTKEQQKQLNYLGLTFTREKNDEGKFVVSLFGPKGILSKGIDSDESKSLDIALSGHIAVYGNKPQPVEVVEAPVEAVEAAPADINLSDASLSIEDAPKEEPDGHDPEPDTFDEDAAIEADAIAASEAADEEAAIEASIAAQEAEEKATNEKADA